MTQAALKIWLIVSGALCGIVLTVALVLANNTPTLTYSSDWPDHQDDIEVSCSASSDLIKSTALRHQGSIGLTYEVTRGADALERFKREDSSMQSTTTSDRFATTRGINDDCVRAETARLWTVIWVLTTLVPLGLWFAVLCVLRLRPAVSSQASEAPG